MSRGAEDHASGSTDASRSTSDALPRSAVPPARAALLADLARTLRQFHGLGASYFRAAAARGGMTATDLQVIDLLESTGPATAGQLADLTGLTTGAITGMLNRLEESGIVRRERDPQDGRRVIVRLVKDQDQLRAIDTLFASLGHAWEDLTATFDDERLAFLLDVLQRGNALSRQAIVQLREAPAGEEGMFSSPLGDLEHARLVVSSGLLQLTLRAGAAMADLYRARFDGPTPDVKVKDGTVTIRYPRRLALLSGKQGAAEVTLSTAIPWSIAIQAQASTITAELGGLDLAGLEVKGGVGGVDLNLPVPSGIVPVRVSGDAAQITVRRPAGVAARAHLKGWVSQFAFDDQSLSGMSNDVRLQSTGYDPTAPCYDIEIASSASMVTITSA